ncbi:MAG: GGDEF domain-containing protein [Flavobacteriaceae bacterium]|nr:MAG: GGDEF domain-containing protein [Flavobacteriaceae bacterium]
MKIEKKGQALHEDQSFHEAILERVSEGVYVYHDISTYPFVEFTVWNQRMFEITGYSMEQINNLGWYQIIYPDPELYERALIRMKPIQEGDNLCFEHWEIKNADGEKRLVSISTSTLTAKDGSLHVLGLMRNLTEEERLRTEAMHYRNDCLTGVKNRRGFFENARLIFDLAARQAKPVKFAYLDVDNLRKINDKFGHYEGDKALKAVGTELLSAVRSSDLVGRLGGDEFAIVLLSINSLDTKAFFDRLHKQLNDMMREKGWANSVSIGVVSFSDSIPDIQDVINYADVLMYKVKMNGKGRVIYEESNSDNSYTSNNA